MDKEDKEVSLAYALKQMQKQLTQKQNEKLCLEGHETKCPLACIGFVEYTELDRGCAGIPEYVYTKKDTKNNICNIRIYLNY